jgi:outer membrane protein assembly factor BamB
MNNCVLWRTESEWPLSLVLAGDTLVVGGDREVAGFHAERGTLRWKHAVKGGAYGLAAADGMLLVSTDEGVIHCLRAPEAVASLAPASGGKEVRP